MKRLALAIAVAFVAGAVAAPPTLEAVRRRTIVLAVFDTTRLDEIGAYGGAPGVTPALDALAREGTVYDAAFAPDSFTFPSHAAMFSGRVTGTDYNLAPGGLTEKLHALGYRTVGVSANWILDKGTSFDRGFDFFTNVVDDATRADLANGTADAERRRERATGDRVVETVRRGFEEVRGDEPLFLFVNFMDPHDPYTPGTSARRRLAPHAATSGHLRSPDGSLTAFLRSAPSLPKREREDLRKLYRAEIFQADAAFGALERLLENAGRRKDAFVVAVADHGERLGEDGEWTHNLGLSEEEVHVPLIVSGPGVPRGRRAATPVGLSALGPALEAFAKNGTWAPGTELPLLFHHAYRGNETPGDPLTRRDVSGIVDGDLRLTRGPNGCRLFARASRYWSETRCDPGEETASRLIVRLNDEYRRRVGMSRLRGWTTAPAAPEWLRQLKLLGYLSP